MPYHHEWVVAHNGILMVMSEATIKTFNRYVQDELHKTEAGGILLGMRRGDHFEIISATEPTKYDIRARTHWQRSRKVHSTVAKQAWQQSNGQITYIGEWHTHPENIPSPSFLDINEWHKLSAGCPYRSGYIVVVVGIDALWCGVAQQKNMIMPMTKIS